MNFENDLLQNVNVEGHSSQNHHQEEDVVDWKDQFVAPCTVEDMRQAAIRQGPRVGQRPKMAYYYVIRRRASVQEPSIGANPPFSLAVFCGMAILNSPSREMTTSDVYNCVVHHFGHFRPMLPFKASLRRKLRDKRFFRCVGSRGSQKIYSLVDEEAPGMWPTQSDWTWIEHDARGREFFEKLLNGGAGFPR